VGFKPSLDYAAGAASYGTSSSGGFAGTVNVAFSDIMGDHRFELYTDLYGDILNSDLVIQYWLLPYRVDYGFTFFQFQDIRSYNPYRERVWTLDRGVQAVATYPFNRFVRVEAGPTGYFSVVSRDTWNKNPDVWRWDSADTYTEVVFQGAGALVFDNTFWDWDGPARGTRARLGIDVSFLSARKFQDLFVDFRNYQRIGRRFVFASRLFGIRSFGADADRYYVGGVRFLEYAPGQLVVRGYQPAEFYDRNGPAAAIASFELRYPFIDRLKLAFPLPIEFGGVRGVAFMDAGLVKSDTLPLVVWDSQNSRLQDLKVGIGAGIRIQISYFLLKFDFARPLSATSDNSWKFIFGLGTDF
jgi:outer membrane protein assembly factor BamA